MKKITLIAAAFIAVSFASCSKAKTCTCTISSTNGSGHTSTVTDVTSYDKIGSSTANTACPKTKTTIDGNTTTSATCVLS